MKSWWRERLSRRPWWMNALMFFCAFMALVYMPWDFLVKPVAADEEAWLGLLLRGWAAKLTEPLHWAIYAAGLCGFWQRLVTRLRFFKPTTCDGDTISGERFRRGETGAPVLEKAVAFIDCRLVDTVARGDHTIMVGEVVDAGVMQSPENRPDDATLWLKDLGEKTFYGG